MELKAHESENECNSSYPSSPLTKLCSFSTSYGIKIVLGGDGVKCSAAKRRKRKQNYIKCNNCADDDDEELQSQIEQRNWIVNCCSASDLTWIRTWTRSGSKNSSRPSRTRKSPTEPANAVNFKVASKANRLRSSYASKTRVAADIAKILRNVVFTYARFKLTAVHYLIKMFEFYTSMLSLAKWLRLPYSFESAVQIYVLWSC